MNLKIKGKAYPIHVGKGAIEKLPAFLKKHKFEKVFILSDLKLVGARKKLKTLLKKSSLKVCEIRVQAGESLKSIETVYPIYGELLKMGADRDSILIALGGGSIGDVGGFIASTYLRGIPWIGIPTTLLAQVDSSVGGKTGINHSNGKNLIGTFHQPSLVVCDTDFLSTLSAREISSGMGEVVKYAITYDLKFFETLEKNLEKALKLQSKLIQKTIDRAIGFKCKAVASDEFDRTGVREILNFGHTFGHALETLTHYQTYQHGEAVIWGMRFAVALSVIRRHLDTKSAERIDQLLKRIPTPPLPSALNEKKLLLAMKRDKKASHNQVRFVLLKRIGVTISDRDVRDAEILEALERIST